MYQVKSAIFDLDGTLVDSLPGIRQSFLHAIRTLGHAIEDDFDIRPIVGPPIAQGFQHVLSGYGDDRISEAVALYRSHYRDVGLRETVLYPHVAQALMKLKERGFHLYVATSKRQRFAEQIITNNQIGDYFDRMAGTTDDGRLDDKSRLLAQLLGVSHIDSSNAVMIGDRSSDIVAAKANGISSIGVLWGYGDLSELKMAGAETLCDNIACLPFCIMSAVNRH